MSKPTEPLYVWLRRIRKLWLVDLELYNGIFGGIWLMVTLATFVGIVIAAACQFEVPIGMIGKTIGGGWGLFLTINFIHVVLLYTRIRCPHCGFNPTRTKKEGKWMSPRILTRRLMTLTACPSCGDQGEAIS
jgi:hypothetical protein